MGNAAEQLESPRFEQNDKQPHLRVLEKGHSDVDKLRNELQKLTELSQTLSLKDKKEYTEWLKNSPESRNVEQLSARIKHFPESEKAVKKQLDTYKDEVSKALAQGLIARKSAIKFERWFSRDLSYLERQEFLSGKRKDDLKDPKRKEVLEEYAKLPRVMRNELKQRFFDADLQERQVMIKPLLKEHKELKGAFLKLPEEFQKKHMEQFKKMNLKDRRSFLKSMKVVKGESEVDEVGAKKSPEKNESEKITDQFEAKMARLVKDNLFSRLSMASYGVWFKGLSLAKKRAALEKSDLDNPERVTVRDQFYALDKDITQKYELEFRTSDLNKRKFILQKLTGAATTEKSSKHSYPETIVEQALERALHSPELRDERELYTITEECDTLRLRAERRLNAQHVETLTEKAEERGNEVDESQTLNLETLTRRKESRLSFRRLLLGKKEKGELAVHNNIRLRKNDQREEMTGEQFKREVVDHQKDELLYKLSARVAQRLPGIDESQVRKIAERMNLKIDLRDLPQAA